MDYRFSKNRPEIVKTLADKLTSGSKLTVWQKKEDGNRSFLEKMIFNSLYPDEGVFTLNVDQNFHNLIDSTKDIYFLLDGHDFIFKTKLAVEQKEFLTLQIPREVQLKELRVHDRKYFILEDKQFVEVEFFEKNSAHKISLICPLVNISDGGACIIITKETLGHIDFDCDVLIRFTSEFQEAVVRNARVFMKQNLNYDELYAIGVEFKYVP